MTLTTECKECHEKNIDDSEIHPVYVGFDAGYTKIHNVIYCDLHGIVRIET